MASNITLLSAAGVRYLTRKSSGVSSLLSTVTLTPGISISRGLSTTTPCQVKQILTKEEGDKIIVEGKYVESPREKYLVNFQTNQTDCKECPLCKLGLTVRHTDVLIINQFLNSKGKLLPRKVTGLCKDQHKRMDYLVVMAEKAGLIKRDVNRIVEYRGEILYQPDEWEEPHFKKYYDETVIEEFLYGRRRRH